MKIWHSYFKKDLFSFLDDTLYEMDGVISSSTFISLANFFSIFHEKFAFQFLANEYSRRFPDEDQ